MFLVMRDHNFVSERETKIYRKSMWYRLDRRASEHTFPIKSVFFTKFDFMEYNSTPRLPASKCACTSDYVTIDAF